MSAASRGRPRPFAWNRQNKEARRRTEHTTSDAGCGIGRTRGGRSVAKPTIDATAQTLSPIVRANVDLSATLMTDAWRGYITIGREFEGGHHRVDHGTGEYVREEAHVNMAESFFALLKRGIVGSFHHVSLEHLHR
jgi:ISXO2-like transposase domain